MPWTGTRFGGGKIQRCTICGAHVHMRDTVRHDRREHAPRTAPAPEGSGTAPGAGQDETHAGSDHETVYGPGELPGMWDEADFLGGKDGATGHAGRDRGRCEADHADGDVCRLALRRDGTCPGASHHAEGDPFSDPDPVPVAVQLPAGGYVTQAESLARVDDLLARPGFLGVLRRGWQS